MSRDCATLVLHLRMLLAWLTMTRTSYRLWRRLDLRLYHRLVRFWKPFHHVPDSSDYFYKMWAMLFIRRGEAPQSQVAELADKWRWPARCDVHISHDTFYGPRLVWSYMICYVVDDATRNPSVSRCWCKARDEL